MGIPFQSGGRTPLHIAATKGCMEIVTLLLAAKADANAVDFDNNTPWLLACMNAQPEVAKLLLPLTRVALPTLTAPLESKSSVSNPDQSITSTPLVTAIVSTTTVSTTECKDKTPSPEWLAAKRKQDLECVKQRLARQMEPEGAFLEQHVMKKVWTAQECLTVLKAVQAAGEARGWTSDRHLAYATTDIPSSEIPAVDSWVRKAIAERVFPTMVLKYFGSDMTSRVKLRLRDLFFVKYEFGPGAQDSLAMHRDGSILSFNVLLNNASDFDGGGTYFEKFDKTVTIEQGDFVLHSGQLRHAGRAITRGVRFILVGFVDAFVDKPAKRN